MITTGGSLSKNSNKECTSKRINKPSHRIPIPHLPGRGLLRPPVLSSLQSKDNRGKLSRPDMDSNLRHEVLRR